MSYLLNPSQVADLTASNLVVQSAVNNLIDTGYWPNGNTGVQGWSVYDPTYGNLLISEDANGFINYNADSLPSPAVINSQPENSPAFQQAQSQTPTNPQCPGWSSIGSFNDFLACLAQAFKSAEYVSIGVVAYLLYKELK